LPAPHLCSSFIFLLLLAQTARRIDRFDEYTAELRKKWGDAVV
jgi:hypothetical protein